MVTLLDYALRYHALAWRVIPMAGKRPAVRWKRWQTRSPTIAQLKRWFSRCDVTGLAVLFGEASGGLVSRDFDDMETCERWAADHPDLESSLPTVATSRGRHVYCRATLVTVQRARQAIGKPDGIGAIAFDDGELRCGHGCYSVIPPSAHSSGVIYRWLGPWADKVPPIDEIPLVDDLFEAGLIDHSRPAHTQELHKSNTEYSSNGVGGEGVRGSLSKAYLPTSGRALAWTPQIEAAIEATLPNKPGQRHRQVFKLCRALRALPEFAKARASDLQSIAREWHRRALPYITTKPFEETWIDFLKGYPRVKHPLGSGVLREAFAAAAIAEVPEESLRFEGSEMRLLLALCRELQRRSGGEPIYLSCRSVGGLLGVDKNTVSRWLFLLREEGLLDPVSVGNVATMKASEFFYLGEL